MGKMKQGEKKGCWKERIGGLGRKEWWRGKTLEWMGVSRGEGIKLRNGAEEVRREIS